jgi:hypothetical protein
MNSGFYGFPQPTKALYKVYVALITQTSTNIPTAVVLENTIGNVIWNRSDVGIYTLSLYNSFPLQKTRIIGSTFYSPSFDAAITVNSIYAYNTANILTIRVHDVFNNVDVDGALDNTPIEIRVYN